MSKRAQMRARQQQRKRRRRLTTIGVVAAVAVALAALVIRQSSKPVGEIVAVESAVRAHADGRALGRIDADAPVLVQDFSNFT